MKRTKAGVMLSAVLVIALCVSLIAGTTFALFTSESSVNIAVTSGKVDVSAKADIDSVYTKQLGDADFIKGADHTLQKDVTVDEKSVVINNAASGDGVKFNIVVANHSTISVKYRAKWCRGQRSY